MTNLLDKLQLDTKKIVLAIFVCLILVYLDYSFIISKQQSNIRNIQPKIIQLKKDLDKLNKDLAMLQEQKNKQPNINQKSASTLKEIIPESQAVPLLESISDIAKNCGVQIMQIKSSKEQSKTPSSDIFPPLFISLNLSGDYHRLGKFINDLENHKILISVESFKITSHQENYIKQNIDLVLKTYVSK